MRKAKTTIVMNIRHLGLIVLLMWGAYWSIAQTLKQLISPALISQATASYGAQIEPVLLSWGQLVVSSQDQQELNILTRINDYFNSEVKFISDQQHWQQEDYWATPLESLGTKGGDCEDFVVAKYFSLIQAGIDQNKLRITYVKSLKLNQAHMVLAYYAKPKSEPLILDNLIPQIRKASKRRDLAPVYSFNGAGMWLERMSGNSIRVGDANGLDMWTDVLQRMNEQGLGSWLNLKDHN